jgi:hypothetical protein
VHGDFVLANNGDLFGRRATWSAQKVPEDRPYYLLVNVLAEISFHDWVDDDDDGSAKKQVLLSES